MKDHLPYNVLLIATVIAIGLMAVFNLTMRQSRFAVRVGYAIPVPPSADAAPALPSPRTAPSPAPEHAQPQPAAEEIVPIEQQQEPVVLVRFPLEINVATYEELQFISGIGPVTAGNIIRHREQLGGFTHISQLLDVSGVGPATFERITAYLYITGEERSSLGQDQPYLYTEDDILYDQEQSYN